MILPLQLMFLAIIASAQICQPGNLRQGYFSQYSQSPTDGTIAYHQDRSGKLPQDISAYVGVVAVRDCGLVGDDAWIRITDERTNPDYVGSWLPVKIFDCSGHVETTEWMDDHNILGELGYYLANDLDLYGKGDISGEMILEAPASVEMICEPATMDELATPIPVYVPQSTLTIPQMLTPEVETPTITPTATPTPLPTAAVIWRAVTSSARAIAFEATPTPRPAMVEVPILNVQDSVTVFDTIENLPLILASLFFIFWLGFGLLMFLIGRLSSRSAGKADRTLYQEPILTSSQVREVANVLQILQRQYPDLSDDEP